MSGGTILNVRGCNASGKTTSVREFIKLHPEAAVETIDGNTYTRCTEAIYALGRYDRKNGGCDSFDGREHVIQAIKSCIMKRQPQVIIYEGMLYSKTFKMARDIDSIFRVYGYRYKGIYLHRSFASVIKLLEERNNGADYNIANIHGTFRANESTYRKILKAGLDIAKIEVEHVPLSEMGRIIQMAIKGADAR